MKKILLIISVVLISAAGIAYYYHSQLTRLPEWYRKDEWPDNTTHAVYYRYSETDPIRKQFQYRPKLPMRSPVDSTERITLNAEELHQILFEQIWKTTKNDSVFSAMRASYLKIENDLIETGAVVNLPALLKMEQKGSKYRLEKLFSFFPFMENQEMFLSVSGKPVIENGAMTIDSLAIIRIGETHWTLPELSGYLGKDLSKIRQKIKIKTQNQSVIGVCINHKNLLELSFH